MSSVEAASQNTRVFISYRSQPPDSSLAEEFYTALKAAGYQPFMAAKSIRLGENWPQRIDEELEQADYFVLLLSEKSVVSEMVTEEVRRARELRDRNNGKPAILPIRVCFPINFPVALNYDLRGYLQRTQQREWKSPTDTPAILEELLSLLSEDGKGARDGTSKESTESADSKPRHRKQIVSIALRYLWQNRNCQGDRWIWRRYFMSSVLPLKSVVLKRSQNQVLLSVLKHPDKWGKPH